MSFFSHAMRQDWGVDGLVEGMSEGEVKKEDMILKESMEKYMGGLRGRKGM